MLRASLLVLAFAALGLVQGKRYSRTQVESINQSINQPTVQCGLGSYDFSKLTSSGDWYGLDQHYNEIYYLNICQNGVQNLWCTLNDNTKNVSICQVAAGDTSSTFSISNNDQSAATWSYINGKDATNGIQMTSATGDKCPNGKARTGIAQFVCGKSTGVITAITENPTCTYTLTVPTDMLCTQDSVPFEMDPEYVKKVQHMRPTLRA